MLRDELKVQGPAWDFWEAIAIDRSEPIAEKSPRMIPAGLPFKIKLVPRLAYLSKSYDSKRFNKAGLVNAVMKPYELGPRVVLIRAELPNQLWLPTINACAHWQRTVDAAGKLGRDFLCPFCCAFKGDWLALLKHALSISVSDNSCAKRKQMRIEMTTSDIENDPRFESKFGTAPKGVKIARR